MLINSLKYHFREAGWRVKKTLRSGLANINRLRAGTSSTDPNAPATIGYEHSRLSPARDGLLLRDFAPDSTLRARATEVRHARYPVIDVHCHLNDGIVMQRSVNPEQFVRVMNETNVKAAINLTGGWGERLRGSLDLTQPSWAMTEQRHCERSNPAIVPPRFSRKRQPAPSRRGHDL